LRKSYVIFVREGKTDKHWQGEINLRKGEVIAGTNINKEKPKGARVSYHASGFIRYHNLKNNDIYGEPIFHITKPFGFFRYSIPSIEKLDIYTKSATENDIILEILNKPSDRISFDCVIAPWDFVFPDSPGISIRYERLFSFSVLFDSGTLPTPPELNDYFHYFSPSMGLYDQSAFDRETALLHFHQKVQGTRNLIIYSPNSEGVYTVIFSVPMRIAPKVRINFEETSFQIEMLKVSNTHMRFKVKDKYGQTLKKEVKITGLELDAEF
jgi:hypothetical protein